MDMGLRPSLIAVLGAATLLFPAGGALAQEASPPIQTPGASETPRLDGSELTAVFPTELGGVPWTTLQIRTGQEIVAGLDPDDPSDAIQLADAEAFVEVAGVPFDAVTIANGFRSEEGDPVVLGAIRVEGADPADMQDLLDDWVLPGFARDMSAPRQETGQVEGRDVVLLHNEGSMAFMPRPYHFLISGDTIWIVNVTDELLTEAFDKLP